MASFFRLNDNPDLHVSGPVIKEEDFVAWVSAETLIHEAEAKAAQIIEKAKEESEEQNRRGYELGLEKGAEVAAANGVKWHRKLTEEFQEELTKVHRSIPHLVSKALEKIFGELPDELILQKVIAQTLKHHSIKGQVMVHVNPDDFINLSKGITQWQGENPNVSQVDLQKDKHLERGSFKVESEGAVIASSPDAQLEALKEAINGPRSKSKFV